VSDPAALAVFDDFGPGAIYARNRELTASLRAALSAQGVICSARDGNLRLAVHFYNHEDDIEQLVTALTSAEVKRS
jgi:cysteine desulfurase / selenocysteine lyase